jgi:hypothetical protein
MDPGARSFSSLIYALGSAGFVVRTYEHFINVFEPTAGRNYAAYLANRPPSARRRIKKYEGKERQLKRSGIYRAEFVNDEVGLERALHDFTAVFEASWKEPDHHPEFLPACMRAAAKVGCLRLATLYIDNKPAATYLVFLAGKKATFYRTAYHPDHAKMGVGALVKLYMIRHLLDDEDVDEIEFGRDREAYKKIWGSSERVRRGILAFNCRSLGGLLGLTQHLLFELRDWLAGASRPVRARLKELRERSSAPHSEDAGTAG